MRFKVTGTRTLGLGDGEYEADVYVNAPDPDAALRRAGFDLLSTTRVERVPDDEGRGVLWRLWRRLFNG